MKLSVPAQIPGTAPNDVPLPGPLGGPEFMTAYQMAIITTAPKTIGSERTKLGSISELLISYYADAFFTDLALATQKHRRQTLERFRNHFGEGQVRTLRPEHLERIFNGLGSHPARNLRKALMHLMAYAIRAGWRKDDPTIGVKLRRSRKSCGHLTWGEVEIAKYRATHVLGTVARLVLELGLNVAARRGDAYLLDRQHVKNGRLVWVPSKTRRSTGIPVAVRLLPELEAAIAAMPASDALTFLVTEQGTPFRSASTFGNAFAKWCREAGLKPIMCDDGRTRTYSFHGLRKAACVQLAYAGAELPEIMAVSGHTSLAQLQVYLGGADRMRLADAAMLKLSRKQNKTYKPRDPRLTNRGVSN
jgi:integrase